MTICGSEKARMYELNPEARATKIKRVIVVVEAMDHEYLQEINPPNMMRWEVHPAVSFGLGSRPSCGALIGGMLPVCQIPSCYHRDIQGHWSNPFFLTTMKRTTDKMFLLSSNGWTIELLLPWISSPEERKLNFDWVLRDIHSVAEEMVTYFLEEKDKYSSYFAYIHLFETHWPFIYPGRLTEEVDLERDWPELRKKALLFLDGQVGRIMDACNDARVVICSDHNLPPHKVSAATDVPSPKTMLSFIATNFKVPYSMKEILGEKVSHGHPATGIAKEYWLS